MMDGKKKNRKKKGNQHKLTEDAASKVAVQESNNGDVEENRVTDNSTNVDTQSHGMSESDMKDAKKKNDKSKGNQPNVEDATPNSVKLVVHEPNNDFTPQENHNMNNSTHADIQSLGVSESDTEHDKHKMHEENIAKLQEKVMQLEKERTSWLQKQICFEEKIKLLQEEIDLHVQKGAVLEEKVQHLEMENDKLIQNKVILEDKINNVESITDSLFLTEVLLKERITGVEESSIALDMKVKELDGSRNSFLESNQQLLEKVIGLESRIQSLEERAISRESLTENMAKLPEDAFSVQNAEVINLLADQKSKTPEFYEKIDGLNLESANSEHSTSAEFNHSETLDRNYTSAASHNISELSEETTKSGEDVQSMQLLDKLVAKDGANGVVSEIVGPPPQLDAPRISEAAAIPFDEIQIHEDSTKAVMISDEAEAVPFSDAPLVGAPFRLISFVAKFVSGADLVKQNSSSSDR